MSIIKTIKGKMTLRRRIALLLIALFLLIALIVSLTVKDRLGLSVFHRWITYDNEDSIAFSHGVRSTDLFLNLDFKLLVCSDTTLQLFSATGESLLRQVVSFRNPAVSTNGKQVVVYDAGGQNLYVISKNKVAFQLSLSSDQYILSATLNQNGWLAVTSKVDGYKGVVTIYNASYQETPVVVYRNSTNYLINAIVTADNRGIYILTPGQSGGIFESKLLYYDLSKQEEAPSTQISLGNNMVISMHNINNRCWVLTESTLFILSSGELAAKYDFSGQYLKRASMGGNDFAVLLLSHSQTGNAGTLVTVDSEGVPLGSVDLEEQVLAMSAAGRRVAVLTSSGLHIYNRDLSRVNIYEEIQGVRNLALYPDGSVGLITEEFVRLYIP